MVPSSLPDFGPVCTDFRVLRGALRAVKNWVPLGRDQAFLLPPSIARPLPADVLARFIADAVERLGLYGLLGKYEARARGSNLCHPAMRLALFVCGYATGVFSSGRIERAYRYGLAFRKCSSPTANDSQVSWR